MKLLKYKIYLLLFLPFIFAGIGLYTFLHFVLSDGITLFTYIIGALIGLLMYFVETKLLIGMIKHHFQTDKNEVTDNKIH